MRAVSMEEARDRVISAIRIQPEVEMCSVYQSEGRVVSRTYTAQMNQPPFDRSPLDGFALHHEDVSGASENTQVTLRITHKIYAGDDYRVKLQRGETARIMTGAGIPEGADCVIRQEDVTFDEEKATFYTPMKRHDNICDMGEDMSAGDVIMEKGEVLKPVYGAALAGQGYFQVEVYKQLRIGVLATGSELTEDLARPGQIYNSNAPMLAMRLSQFGMLTISDYCNDQVDEITDKIRNLLETCHTVITTGGASTGEKDYLPAVVGALQGEMLFHGIAMKPGSPMMLARVKDKLLICLSGNPFAAMATLELIALPGLLKASGRTRYYPVIRNGRLENAFPKTSKHGRRFIRALYEEGTVRVPENHSSGSITSMIGCNCMIDIPAGCGALQAGDIVKCVLLLDDEHAVSTACEKLTRSIPVFCICGTKNVGKTTVMEQLVKMLTKKGIRIGVIKHDGHDFIPDVPWTDSFRAREAGAAVVSVYSSKRMLMYDSLSQELQYEDILNRLSQISRESLNLILVEGWKNSAYPKIEIMRKEVAVKCVASEPVYAICGDVLQEEIEGRMNGCPVYGFDEIHRLAEMVLAQSIMKSNEDR